MGTVAPGQGRVVIRPERVRLAAQAATAGANAVPAIVDNLFYVGATTQVVARLPHGPAVHALVVNDSDVDADHLRPGTPVTLTLPPEALRLLERAPDSVAQPVAAP